MTADEFARFSGMGCDYCGAMTGLERYDANGVMDNGLRCVDAAACSKREDLQAEDEERE